MPDPITQDLLAYIAASPTPMHCVAESARRLDAAGFKRLDERDSWAKLGPGAYYMTTTGTNLIAFVVPEQRTSFHIVGAHTDSPNLRLKPNAEYASEGYAQLGVEVYGGVLLNSWLDRDCGLAGRVFTRDGEKLIRIDKAVLRVAQLAIHLDRDVNDKGLVLNKQDHLAPLFGLTGTTPAGSLKKLIADAAQVDADAIIAHELQLFDLTAPSFGGANDELIFSARLDNQASCHAALTALIQHPHPEERGAIAVVALFDHEEVGSDSVGGAGSAVLPRVLERLIPDREAFHAACARSSCISADMSHAVHPNYASKHEPRHKPQLNGGPVIKTNTNQRYATTATTGAMFAELCSAEGVPVQYYNHRTDLPCGSTIGPITSTLLGIPTVDVGNPMLSMHSARELGGADDPPLMTKVLTRYLLA